MDDNIASFTAITDAPPERAAQYLRLTDGNLEQAIQLFFDSPNLDVESSGAQSTSGPTGSAPNPPAANRSSARYIEDDDGVIHLDSDDDVSVSGHDVGASGQYQGSTAAGLHGSSRVEDDEAMARRLQEEMYGAGMHGGGEDVRAPMARTTETLVGPGAEWTPNDIDDMVAEQLAARNRRSAVRPGIFNQRPTNSVWEDGNSDPTARRRNLSQATGGASEASAKSSLLAEMYRPPFDIICPLAWDVARDKGKEDEKWLLVNIQDQAIFDCQVLNRDIWKNPQIKDVIKEHFLFLQYTKEDPRAQQYLQYYFHTRDSQDAYPHIAIVDPRTGEQVKVWSGPPVPKAEDFLMQLFEFLDRYSLKANVKNPVANRKPERNKVDYDRLTEEQQLEMALQASLTNGSEGPREVDPDELTKPGVSSKGKERATDMMDTEEAEETSEASPFSQISATNPHTEPPANVPDTTRIQFRHSGGRVVRRFALHDPVRRLYEWLKAEPLDGKEGAEFDLIFMGKNLIEVLDSTIADAGLRNGSVMVEFSDN